ncbi:MAG: bifunctional riboflavin kinase/FAD synthetase [Lachnospiraceae bacterium]|nr:bifunctional riboflavin kinase/FAD synthetase [Lachnospiraceae bacterium]
MEYIKNTTDFHIPENTVVSLGKFDGIHRGHGRLLEYLKEKKKTGLKTVIFTFDIPPGWKLGAKKGKVLTTNEEKVRIFEQHGIDYLVECPFLPEIMHMEPEEFVSMLVRQLHVKCMVVGTDFCFGHNRRGDYRLLLKLAGQYGYEVEVVDKVQADGRDISSTFVREEILAGRIERANGLLGYYYFVQGTVVHGNEIGRTLRAPTANLLPPENKLLPPFGVYVTRTSFLANPDKKYGGITNVGCKPTIKGRNPAGVETHLFDFQRQIYGADIVVEFLASVRPEVKFDSLDELKRQLQKDILFGINYYANVTEL